MIRKSRSKNDVMEKNQNNMEGREMKILNSKTKVYRKKSALIIALLLLTIGVLSGCKEKTTEGRIDLGNMKVFTYLIRE